VFDVRLFGVRKERLELVPRKKNTLV